MTETKHAFLIRNAKPSEYPEIGQLLVNVYSRLPGFPKETEQPGYYKLLRNVGELAEKPETEIIIAVKPDNTLLGTVVYFSNMHYYGSGGSAPHEKNSAGFRFLAVDPKARGLGIGKLLTLECIQRAKEKKLRQVIIHTTKTMMKAWMMYEIIGFKRSEDLDFRQGALQVFGFRFMIR